MNNSTLTVGGPTAAPSVRNEGPVEILCKEIGVRFSRSLERPEVLVAFVRVLFERLEHVFWINSEIDKRHAAPADTTDARAVLDLLGAALKHDDAKSLVAGAAAVHNHVHTLKWQCDWASHVYDVASSLASALRFTLDSSHGIQSRHPASAASHLWKQEYGISKFDEYTSEWEHSWAREQFYEALNRMSLPKAAPATDGAEPATAKVREL